MRDAGKKLLMRDLRKLIKGSGAGLGGTLHPNAQVRVELTDYDGYWHQATVSHAQMVWDAEAKCDVLVLSADEGEG